MDIKEQRDKFIKEKLSSDQTILQPSLDVCVNYLNDTKIKQKKYTRKQKNLIFGLCIILAISISFNIYHFNTQNNLNLLDKNYNNEQYISEHTPSFEDITVSTPTDNETEEFLVVENKVEDTDTNSVSNTVQNSLKNEISINASTKNTLTTSEFESADFKKLIELYSVGIFRIYDSNTDEVEKNTVKLLTTLRYLDYCSQKPENKTGSFAKFAALKDNVYLCLNEITKTNYPSHILPTYNEFVTYYTHTDSFAYGDNSTLLTSEKYEILELKAYEGKNGLYNIETRIKRTHTLDNTTFENTFKVKFVVEINKNYTYSKYKIVSMYFENEDKNALDTTYNLVNSTFFTKDEMTEIKKEILNKKNKKDSDKNYIIIFDSIEETAQNKYSVSFKILDGQEFENSTATIVKEENEKIRIDFK